MAIERTRRRLTVEEYEEMARAAVLGEDDRMELIEGEIVEMTPVGHRHARCVSRLTRWFSHRLADVALVWVQNPIHLDPYSEPQPDVVLARLPDDLYAEGHPTPENVFLVVEVADTTVETDRWVKVPLYSRCGIPEVWLVDLHQDTITLYRDPTPSNYRTVRVVRRGEGIAPAAFRDRVLAVADLLPD